MMHPADFHTQVYVGKLGNAYMYETTIAGQTDFFYGFGTLWVTKSQVSLRRAPTRRL